MKDVTQQLADALREARGELVCGGCENGPHVIDIYGEPDECPACHGEHRNRYLVDQIDEALTAFEASRAALSALPARDEGLEALRELSKRATGGDWIVPPTADDDVWNDNGSGSPGIPLLRSERGNYRSWGRQLTDDERRANSALAAAAVNYVRNKLAQEPRK